MSSAICQNFVQNAWKKELCSNCFKSKDEHAEKPKPKPVHLVATDRVEGIIRKGKTSKPKQSVAFLKDLTEVIGYGGEDWSSDNEEDETESSEEDEIVIESDEEECSRELQRITKENTDFNTTSLGEVEVKKSYTQLLLGKPVVDSSGKKKTLLVSVTPFGEDVSAPAKKYNHKNLSHIPIAKSNKEVIAEQKTNSVVLTSYTKNEENGSKKGEKSLLDEISETLENSKNPIQIMAKKKSQKEVALNVDSNKENVENGTTEAPKLEIVEEKSVEHKIVVSEKKISLARTPALKRDIEKPVIYQTSTAKIELLNTKNLKLNKETVNKMKTEVNNNEKVHPGTKATETKDESTSSVELLRAERRHSNEIIGTKERKDEINNTVAEKVVGLPPPIPPKYIPFSQSREQAGIPDGREDPVVAELPPLPITPPPTLETQTSFLHSIPPPIYEKPKILTKPVVLLPRKPAQACPPPLPANLSSFGKPVEKTPLSRQDSNDSDPKNNKRKAPQPPEEIGGGFYSRTSGSPSVREKRPVALSYTPTSETQEEAIYVSPEHSPKRSLSVSTDCLAIDEKRKEKSKARFSLKKFLRMGSSKDLTKPPEPTAALRPEEGAERRRPVIVHPSELNGDAVQVVAPPEAERGGRPPPPPRNPAEGKPALPPPPKSMAVVGRQRLGAGGEPAARKTETVYANIGEVVAQPEAERGGRPPPPPRNPAEGKPALPPPPKSMAVAGRQRLGAGGEPAARKAETVYANIGEVRSSIVPNKPVRTASMREREAQQQQQQQQQQLSRQPAHSYEPVGRTGGNKEPCENVYDYIHSGRSSSPDSDSSRGKGSPRGGTVARLGKRAGSSVDVSGECFKGGNIPRSVSLTYCGSETESEIYASHSFYGSESEVTEDDHDWIQNGRTHKLRSRKGRSIVHKNLEDNYGAVVVANHEALAQVLENVQQTCHIQPALRGLKAQSNLRWTDFSLKSGTTPVTIGSRVFHQAVWGAHHVTLLVDAGTITSSTLQLGTFNLTSVTEFSDLVPNEYLPLPEGNREENDRHTQATVSVLPCIQVNSIPSYCELVKSKIQNVDEQWRDANFVMLQLVNALKTLQAQGIEELPLSLTSFVLCKDMDKDSHHRLCVLQGLASDLAPETSSSQRGTLCTCALRALSLLQPAPRAAPLLHSLLSHERAVSLTQARSVLEFGLWGPSDVALGCTVRERELALQRWLDLQRATVLHGLVCARVHLTVYEECHLLFLVRSNARLMCDASLLIESSGVKVARGDKGVGA